MFREGGLSFHDFAQRITLLVGLVSCTSRSVA